MKKKKKEKISFISEIASSHNGNGSDVIKLSKLHLRSQANYLKYQIFKTENLYPKNEKNFNIFKKIEITYSEWIKIINKFKYKTKLILEPFDQESYNFCKKFKRFVSLKISTTESDNFTLINDSLKNFKKVFLNLSGFTNNEIKFIINRLKRNKHKNKIILMYGFQSYPSELKRLRFNLFSKFKKDNYSFGYADHSLFGLSNDLIASVLLSKNLNCSYFEKHVCLNLKKKPYDYISSVEFRDYNKLIRSVRLFETISENFEKNKMSKEEYKYAEEMHKKAYAKQNIKINSKLRENDLTFLRSKNSNGLKRLYFKKNKFITKKNINLGKFLSKSDLKILKDESKI